MLEDYSVSTRKTSRPSQVQISPQYCVFEHPQRMCFNSRKGQAYKTVEKC